MHYVDVFFFLLWTLDYEKILISPPTDDARNDSPGFSAQYCTYTLMEHNTSDILHVGFVDKRQTAMKSPDMEIKAFKDGLAALEANNLIVVKVVTDAHPNCQVHE